MSRGTRGRQVRPLGYVGGKIGRDDFDLKLIALFPPHRVYVEPFVGGGVFWRKPKSEVEAIGDAHEHLIDFYRVLRLAPNSFGSYLAREPFDDGSGRITHWDETNFHIARKKIGINNPDHAKALKELKEKIRRERGQDAAILASAILYFTLNQQQYASSPKSSFWVGRQKDGVTWDNKIGEFPRWSRRMADIHIIHAPYWATLPSYNVPEAFAFVDPPYTGRSRSRPNTKGTDYYAVEMKDVEKHVRLLKMLHAFRGRVMITHYKDELYDSMLPRRDGWRCVSFPRKATIGTNSTNRGANRDRVEYVYMNYDPS